MGGRFTAGLLAHSAKAMHVLRSEPKVSHDRQASRRELLNGIGDSAATFQLHRRGAAFLEEPCRIARGLLGRNQVSPEQATRNATRLFQEGGAAAVKLEGGRAVADTVRKLTAAGLPVMGHLGLTPQHVHRLGGMRQQARSESAAHELILDALALEDAGAFAIVLEAIPDTVAEAVTSQLKIPTIGIGAGSHCDGQVLVSYDVLGLFDTFAPPFAKQYAQLGQVIVRAAKDYANDVREGLFPKSTLSNPQTGDLAGRRVIPSLNDRAFEELKGAPVPVR